MEAESEFYRVEIDPTTGAVRRLFDRIPQIELIAEPRLAESFRLLLPLPDLESNYILSTEQSPPVIERTGKSLTMRWDGPLSNAQGNYDLAVTVEIEVVAETVQFRISVDNHTPHRWQRSGMPEWVESWARRTFP